MGYRYNKLYGRKKPLPDFSEKNHRYIESRQAISDFYIPFDYQDCFTEYLPPQSEYIYCPTFGKCDILNIQCHRCHDLFFYQWAMCQDESWVIEMMRGGQSELAAKYGTNCSREEAQLHIARYKKMLFEANFNSNVDRAYEDYNADYDKGVIPNTEKPTPDIPSREEVLARYSDIPKSQAGKKKVLKKPIVTAPKDGEDL